MYKVGFIGLGIMGRPMCKNLLKAGYAVTAFDPFAKEALDDVVSCGAARGESNADVASKSDVVITMVPNSPHVRAAVLGKGGVAEGAHEGLDVIDMSSIAPLESKAIAVRKGRYPYDGCAGLRRRAQGHRRHAVDHVRRPEGTV